MLINNITPTKALRDFIRFYRIIHFEFDGEQDAPNAVKAYRPRIEHCLQFTPFDNELVDYDTPKKKNISEDVALFGQHKVLTHRKVGKKFLNFQIVFQPGVLYSTLKTSMEELSDTYTDASAFFGNQLFDINAQLASCKRYEQMIDVVEVFMIKLFGRSKSDMHPVNRIAMEMLNPTETKNIEWYADQSNLSFRQFDRMFKKHTGIAPKDFRNLVRLDQAYLIKNRNPAKDMLSIALESGFYDYQHLSKVYKRYTGYSPTAFYALEQQAPERNFGFYEK